MPKLAPPKTDRGKMICPNCGHAIASFAAQCAANNIAMNTVRYRMNRGMTLQEALTMNLSDWRDKHDR